MDAEVCRAETGDDEYGKISADDNKDLVACNGNPDECEELKNEEHTAKSAAVSTMGSTLPKGKYGSCDKISTGLAGKYNQSGMQSQETDVNRSQKKQTGPQAKNDSESWENETISAKPGTIELVNAEENLSDVLNHGLESQNVKVGPTILKETIQLESNEINPIKENHDVSMSTESDENVEMRPAMKDCNPVSIIAEKAEEKTRDGTVTELVDVVGSTHSGEENTNTKLITGPGTEKSKGRTPSRISSRQRQRRESVPEKSEEKPVENVIIPVKEKLPPVDRPVKWNEGDLVWSLVTGHPLWPCMISLDPESCAQSRLVGSGHSSRRMYHVQFFGDSPEHAWVNESRVYKYTGKDEYENLVKNIAKSISKKPPRVEISNRFINNWNAGIEEVEQALKMEVEKRISEYKFVYVKNLPRKPSFAAIDKDVRKQHLKKDNVLVTPNQDNLKQDNASLTLKTSSLKNDNVSATAKYSNVKKDNVTITSMLNKGKKSARPNDASLACMYCHETYSSQAGMREHCKEKHHDGKPLATENEFKNISPNKKQFHKPEMPKTQTPKPSTECDDDSTCSICSAVFPNKRSLGQHKRFSHSGEAPIAVDEMAHQPGQIVTAKNDPLALPKSLIAIPVPLNKPKTESSTLTTASRVNANTRVLNLSKKDPICVLCEKNGDGIISCTSQCYRSFHAKCLGDFEPGDPFVCEVCKTGKHLCIICNKGTTDGDGLGELKRCVVGLCGRYFHSTCLQIYKLKGVADSNEKSVTNGSQTRCPSHSCATCTSKALVDATRGADKGIKNKIHNRARLFKCIRCPTAYHVSDNCLAAGSILLGGLNIVCPVHFKPAKSLNHHHPVHISWCFVCSKGGELICCATCPAAFHVKCINLDKMPEGDWHCLDCSCGVRPLYDDIIWVKLGTYRWWPGQVTHPNDIPENIARLQHGPGEFVVRFFGSNDYFWLSKCRVFLYQEGDNGATNKHCSKGISGVFKKALQEAEERFSAVMAARQIQEEAKIAENDKKPAPYKHIKYNKPVGNVQIFGANLSEMAKCACKRTDNNPCGFESECLNRMLMYECHPTVCPAGDRCENKRFQKCEYPPSEIFRTDWGGWGLKTTVFIKKGSFVNEYVGELVDDEECKKRIEKAHASNISNFYMLTIDKDRIIDAGPKGNFSRFMNHCCSPNCETQKWMVNGDTRVGLFALRDIMPGEELTFNYNLDCLGNDKTKCMCGSKNCSGFIGVRPRAQSDGTKRERKKKRKPRRSDSIPQHDDFCFRCRQTGTLVCCDYKGCLRAFCLECLHLEKPPYGKWECPCHHCDWCGRRAQYFCSFCPNSFCGSHVQNQLTASVPNKFDTCSDHDPEKAEFEMAQTVAVVNDLMNTTLEDEDTSGEPSPADSPAVSVDANEEPLVNNAEQTFAGQKRKRSLDDNTGSKKSRKSTGIDKTKM